MAGTFAAGRVLVTGSTPVGVTPGAGAATGDVGATGRPLCGVEVALVKALTGGTGSTDGPDPAPSSANKPSGVIVPAVPGVAPPPRSRLARLVTPLGRNPEISSSRPDCCALRNALSALRTVPMFPSDPPPNAPDASGAAVVV